MFLTFGLCMTVLMTLVEKNKTTVMAPLAIGIALFATQLAGIFYTGAAVNTGKPEFYIKPDLFAHSWLCMEKVAVILILCIDHVNSTSIRTSCSHRVCGPSLDLLARTYTGSNSRSCSLSIIIGSALLGINTRCYCYFIT
jgi:hypothetical protein